MSTLKRAFNLCEQGGGGNQYDLHVGNLKRQVCKVLSGVHKLMQCIEEPAAVTTTALLKSDCAPDDMCKETETLRRASEQHVTWSRGPELHKIWIGMCRVASTMLQRRPFFNKMLNVDLPSGLALIFFSILDEVPYLHAMFAGAANWEKELGRHAIDFHRWLTDGTGAVSDVPAFPVEVLTFGVADHAELRCSDKSLHRLCDRPRLSNTDS